MTESTSEIVEHSLGITLPVIYRNLIDSPPNFTREPGINCYLWISPETLLIENRAYIMDPDDLSDIDDGSFLGGVKRRLLYGPKTKITNHRRRYLERWVKPKRFQIGSDGGEETFFISLEDPACAVWAFDLETGNISQRFESLASYVEFVESIEDDDT